MSSTFLKNSKIGQIFLKHILFLLLLLVLYPSLSFSKNGKNILIVHTYDANNERAISFNLGFHAEYESFAINEKTMFHYEYIGAIADTSEDDFNSYRDFFALKYKDVPIDAIISVDTKSFLFLSKKQKEVWGNRDIPVIFSGLNDFKLSMIDSLSNFTGLSEGINHDGNIDLLRTLLPRRQQIYAILDTITDAGKVISQGLYKDLGEYPVDGIVGIHLIFDNSITAIDSLIANGDENTAIYLVSQNKQVFNKVKQSEIPFVSISTRYIENGAIGGYFPDSESDGIASAQIVKKIFNGMLPTQIMVSEARSKYFLNMEAIEKYDISEEEISEVTHNNYYEINPIGERVPIFQYVLFYGSILVLIIIVIITIANYIRRKDSFTRDWRKLAESIPDVVFAIGPMGEYLFISKSAEEIMNIYSDDLIGKTAKQANMPEHIVKIDHEQVIPIFKNKRNVKNEYTLIVNGEERYFETRYSPVKNRLGEIVYVIGVIRNITQRKKAEIELKESQEKFKITMQAVNDGMWEWRPETDEVSFNDRWYSIIGYQRGEISETLDSWLTLLHEEDRDKINAELYKYSRSGDEFKIIFRIKHKAGRAVWIESRGRTVEWTSNGNPKRLVGTHTDVTNRIQAHQELRAAKEEAEAADRLKTFFLSNISHEIRTPMNQIIGYSKLLIRDGLNQEEKVDFSGLINKHAKELIGLIDDIIDISKIESGQIKTNKAFFAVNSVLNDLYITFRSEMVSESKEHLKLLLTKNLPDSRAILINDELRITQVLSNVLNNALKFTEEGEIEFGYNYHRERSELVFFVRDTGIGIPCDKFEEIFEMFRQVDGSFTRKYGGTGLGLAISKRLVALMGGEIWVESEVGKGSTFNFSIPYDESVSLLFDDDDETSLQDINLRGKTILIIDDTVDVLNYFKVLLSQTGVKLLFANNGSEAIELFRLHKDSVDLVLTDIQMPDMEGIQFAKKIKEISNNVVVVAQTAFTSVSEKELFIKAGCDDFIPKPIEDEHLKALFEKYLLKS